MLMNTHPILGDIVRPEHVLELDVATREEAMEALLGRLVPDAATRDKVRQELMEREKMASTALGLGVAVPHVRSPQVEDWALGFARTGQGLEWDSMDGQPVRLVFMLLANQRYALTFVKVISQIVRFVKNGDSRQALLEAPRDELLEVLKRIGK